MSMLSAQRDRLRSIADKLSDMDCHDCASEVRDAADTIWQLRNDCVDLRNENEKLREFIYELIVDEERGHNDGRTFHEHVIRAHKYGIAQDIEVDE